MLNSGTLTVEYFEDFQFLKYLSGLNGKQLNKVKMNSLLWYCSVIYVSFGNRSGGNLG